MTALHQTADHPLANTAPAIRPISILEPQLTAIMAGKCTRIRRPNGLISQCAVGDILWVREPFWLHSRWNQFAPTVALDEGATFYFGDDLANPASDAAILKAGGALGGRRFARTLPKARHRQHLVINAITHDRLQNISLSEIEAEGFISRPDYAAEWDKNLALSVPEVAWARDPIVTVIDFTHVGRPVSESAQ